jgi:hypothetical protein
MYVVEKKMIGGVMRTVRKKIVPPAEIPTIAIKNAQKKGFAFMTNPEKTVSKNTYKTYKGQLNKMSGALGYTTVGQLITKHRQIIEWAKSTYPDISKQKLFMSAVFYVLNQKPFIKMGVAKPYYDEFQKMKKSDINSNAQKGNINKVEQIKALIQIGSKHWKH